MYACTDMCSPIHVKGFSPSPAYKPWYRNTHGLFVCFTLFGANFSSPLRWIPTDENERAKQLLEQKSYQGVVIAHVNAKLCT